MTIAPDWVYEVLSPSTARVDRSRKIPIYAREGVGHLWFIDPLARLLEIYRLDGGRWVVAGAHGGGDLLRAEPFEAAALDPSRWWPAAAGSVAAAPAR